MVVEVRFVRKYVSSDICVERQFPSGTLLSGCDIRAIYTAHLLFAIKDARSNKLRKKRYLLAKR
jgi:hypothetical protein